LDRDPRSGGRFTLGYYLGDCTDRAIEVGAFFLGSRAQNVGVTSAFTPVISRPFFNLNQNMQDVERIAFPGQSTGRFDVHAPSDLWGLDANLRCNLLCGCDWRLNVLGGFRYLDLQESVLMTERVQGLATAPPPLTNAFGIGTDNFSTRNQFYGGQVGVDG